MTYELKKADEIVRALRDYASDCDNCCDCFQCDFACVCGKCGNNAPKIISDLIDSLTAQLNKYKPEATGSREIISMLQSNLSESQRREKAAVEDLEANAETSIPARITGRKRAKVHVADVKIGNGAALLWPRKEKRNET